MDRIRDALALMRQLLDEPNLWKAQNLYFSMKETLYGTMLRRAETGEESARNWVEGFRKLGDDLRIKVS